MELIVQYNERGSACIICII